MRNVYTVQYECQGQLYNWTTEAENLDEVQSNVMDREFPDSVNLVEVIRWTERIVRVDGSAP